MNSLPSQPVVRLKPKKSPKRFRHGAPWIFADEIVLDRRTKAIRPGTVVVVEDSDRNAFATAAFNGSSRIVCRILELDGSADIDADWIKTKLSLALSHRDHVFADPFYRLCHAEADGLPGLIIDRFGDTLVIQANSAWADANLEMISAALNDLVEPGCIIKNASGRARGLEGLDDLSMVVLGDAPDTIPVRMNGAIYQADVLGGQKTGLFFDQRENHAFAAGLSKGGTVLDVFCHVGGFSLAMLAGGAKSAVAVDASAAALDLARAGAKASGFSDVFETIQGDAVKAMQDMHQQGRLFDTVICDPPAFAPRREALAAGLRGYERVAINAAKLVAPGGYLGLCSCSGAVDLAAFKTACVTGIGRAGRRAQLLHTGHAACDHPTHPLLEETAYLKALFFRLTG